MSDDDQFRRAFAASRGRVPDLDKLLMEGRDSGRGTPVDDEAIESLRRRASTASAAAAELEELRELVVRLAKYIPRPGSPDEPRYEETESVGDGRRWQWSQDIAALRRFDPRLLDEEGDHEG